MKKTLQKLSKHLFIGIVLIFTLCNHAFAQTIQIASASDLAKIGVDGAFPLDGDYKQTADIDLSGFSNWTPIGTFTGTYNGQYHSITNLKISGANKGYQGLFSELAVSGEIKNIHLSNININLSDNSTNVGALVGYSRGKIARVSVNNGSVTGYYYVGGLVGTQINTASISECYTNLTVEDNGHVEVLFVPGSPDIPGFPGSGIPDRYIDMKGQDFGALIGVNQNGGTIINCYATGSVTGSNDVGGLIGYLTSNSSSVSNSYSSGAVNATSGFSGGFVGSVGFDAIAISCYWNITTSGKTNSSGGGPNTASSKSDTQMKQQASFAGWDFTNIWKIVEGTSQPTLQWMTLSPLPVSFVNFKAKAQSSDVKLTWQTASESMNKEFIIYRSGDDKKFELLKKIAGAGTITSLQNYESFDLQPLSGNNYYKLTQVDENGKETELSISTAYFGFSETASVQIFPNPAEDKVNVSFGTKKYTDFSITDLNGKILQQMQLKKEESGLSTSMKNYAPGIYLFRFNGEDGSISKKVLKK